MPLLARHTNELLSRLERVVEFGCAEVTGSEFLVWYNQRRFSTSIWRDVAQQWEEMLQSHPLVEEKHKKVPLLVGGLQRGWILLWGYELLPASPKCWVKDVRELARLTVADEPNNGQDAAE